MFMTEELKKNNQNQPTKDQNKKKRISIVLHIITSFPKSAGTLYRPSK